MEGYELVLSFRGPKVETEDEVVEIEDALCELLEQGETLECIASGGSTADREAIRERGGACAIAIVTGDVQATFARIVPFLARAGLIDHVTAAARPLAGESFVTLWPNGGRPFDRE